MRRYLPYYWRLAVEPVNPLAIEALRVASLPGLSLSLAPPVVATAPELVYVPIVHPQAISQSVIPYWQVLLATDTTPAATEGGNSGELPES